jgi:hypothetical protein
MFTALAASLRSLMIKMYLSGEGVNGGQGYAAVRVAERRETRTLRNNLRVIDHSKDQ